MNVRRLLLSGFCSRLSPPSRFSEIVQQPATTKSRADRHADGHASPHTQSQGSAPLRVMVGKSLLINTTERLKRISVTDPAIAYATPSRPRRFSYTARLPAKFPC